MFSVHNHTEKEKEDNKENKTEERRAVEKEEEVWILTRSVRNTVRDKGHSPTIHSSVSFRRLYTRKQCPLQTASGRLASDAGSHPT